DSTLHSIPTRRSSDLKVFTGKTHMPSPTKVLWTVNVNLLNNSKYHYDMVKNVDPNIECIVVQDLEMTSGVNYADVAMAINSWMRSEEHTSELQSRVDR